jgi:hypothetical protein
MQKNLSLTTAGPLGDLFGGWVCAQLSINIYMRVSGGEGGEGGARCKTRFEKEAVFCKKNEKNLNL